MLTSLHIKNYALIEQLDLALSEGFSVITGETGAGKSIILGALGLLQGHRADVKSIKAGEKKCIVEGEFAVDGLGVKRLLEAVDIDCDDDSVIIRREIMASGKSRTFINDTPATLATLKDISTRLIDIHSQHQNLLLGHETFIIDTVDCVAGAPNINKEYEDAYDEWTAAERRLKQLREESARSQSDQEFLAFQLHQLEEAGLESGELEALEEEQQTLAHAEDIKSALCKASSAMSQDEFDVCSVLRQAIDALQDAGEYLANAAELAERLDSALIEIDDVRGEVEAEAERVEFDPRRLEYVDDRIGTIMSLLKKHRLDTVDQLIAKTDEMRQALDAIENADERIAEQEARVKAARKKLLAAAARLTETRQKAAQEIERGLTESMHGLGMPHATILLEFSRRQHPDRSGLDAVRFLFSANKSVPPQDVAQTASGGEVARLMLALKALIAQKKNMPTIIFDEIDTGVSGTMAERMGQVMGAICSHAQVLCITHLPQIAALGDHHFRVYKEENDEGTRSHIVPLDDEERVREVANMLSGAQLTPEALANARQLLATKTSSSLAPS